MRLIPKDKRGKIQFCKSHLTQWAAHASELGVTPEQIADLAAAIEEAEQAMNAQLRQQAVAQSATLRLNVALETMQTQASVIVGTVRANAGHAGENLYILARIPAPKKPSPIGSLGKPTGFRTELQQTGELTLTWKCKNPVGSTGAFYEIKRQIDQGKFIHIGRSGKKRFVDETIPPGTKTITYRVRAIRSTGNGPVADFNVSFGTTGRPVARQGPPTAMAA